MKSIVLIDVEKQPEVISDHYYSVSRTEPLGLLYLESFLKAHGVEVTILKLPLTTDDWNIINQAGIIGLSGLTYAWSTMKSLAREIKGRNPNVQIIAGREHASLYADNVLAEESIDAVVVGEGERPLLSLAEGTVFKDVPSLVYRNAFGEIVANPLAHSITTQELFPLQRRKPWMKNMFPESITVHDEMAGVMMSRGCAYKCEFCTAEGMWGGHRKLGYQHALDEVLRVTEQYHIDYFAFHDLMLNTSKQMIYSFCDEVRERKIEADFFAMMSASANFLDFGRLKKAGFNEIGVGIEIPSDRRLDIGKGLSFKRTIEFVKAISDADIFVRGYIILGWPWEKSVSSLVDEYCDALKLLPVNALRVHFMTPFPGTAAFRKYKELIRFKPLEDGFDHFTTMEPVLEFNLSPLELYEARDQIIKRFYSSTEFAHMSQRQAHSRLLKEMNDSIYSHHMAA